MTSEQEEKAPKTSGRSPSFPYVDLEKAIDLVRKVHTQNRRRPASREVAFTYMGLSPKSGPGRRTLAALKAFGLIELKDDVLHLTPLARRIIEDERPVSPERDVAIKRAALSPPIHQRLWEKYEGELPPDLQLRHDLIWGEEFNPSGVEDFIGQIRSTLDYAALSDSGSIQDEVGGDETEQVEVGVLIQWQSQGVDQFVKPRRVRALQELDGEQWVFVDGSESGIPASQVTVVKQAPKEPAMPEAQIDPPQPKTPTLPLPQKHADTFELTIPHKRKLLSVRIHLPEEDLDSEEFEKVLAHLSLLIKKPNDGAR